MSEPADASKASLMMSKLGANPSSRISPAGGLSSGRAASGVQLARAWSGLSCGTWEPSARCEGKTYNRTNGKGESTKCAENAEVIGRSNAVQKMEEGAFGLCGPPVPALRERGTKPP